MISKEEEFSGFIFFLPFLISFFFFIIYPILYGIITLTNVEAWLELFQDRYYHRSIINTIFYVGVGVNVKMLLALFISGLLIFKDKYKIVKILSWIFITPWALPEVVTLMGMKWIFDTNWGTVNVILHNLSLPRIEFFTTYLGAMFTIIYTHIWRFTPFWTLILYSLRLTIPQEMYEAAEIDGASLINKFRFVTWPLLRNTYFFITVLSTIWVIGSFVTPWLLTGGAPGGTTHVAATIGYFYYFLALEPSKGLAATMSFLPLIIVLLIIVIKLRGGVR